MNKKVPLRMCIVCRNMVEKSNLIRVVKSPEGGIFIDDKGKANGRGAYICKDGDCLDKLAKKRGLNSAFKENIAQEVYDRILDEYRNKN